MRFKHGDKVKLVAEWHEYPQAAQGIRQNRFQPGQILTIIRGPNDDDDFVRVATAKDSRGYWYVETTALMLAGPRRALPDWF